MAAGATAPGYARRMSLSLIDEEIRRVVASALAEDIGRGDLTTAPLAVAGVQLAARLVFRGPGVVCGLPVAAAVFRVLDARVVFTELVSEGARLDAPGAVASVAGEAAAILSGERVALNLVARLSATATLTRRYVDAVSGTRATILDTRKTTPGLRALEKYAVRIGGGRNHRFGLDGGILLKDNHFRLAGSISEAVHRVRIAAPPAMRVEVEVEDLDQLREALTAGADMILLDNMALAPMREAVAIVAGRVPLEASGGITLENARAVAKTGVDFISVGALTHSAGALDVSLEVGP